MNEHLQLRDLLGPYVMGALGPEEEREVEAHLEECPSCREEVADLRLAHERLTDLVNMEESPPPELKDRLLTGMPRRETRRVPLVAAAAILCALAVLGVLYYTGFFAPDEVASANLQATDLAPKAGGELRVREEDPNARAELEVWGLPQPGKDEYYELWFGKEGGRMSAGTFTVDARGRETLTMTVPEKASSYDQVGITIEQFPKEPRMSAAKPVLIGELEES
ncbi:MAG TPA: anti-sigma factor [Rubrobacteraceae bacterium]|nr:anti-sigma factor [Rubrobacteraceae bacterium]